MDDVPIKNGIVIPGYELEITASRSGGAGGQHVNKTNSRITVRWNVAKTSILNETQKELILRNLQSELTQDGDLIIHQSVSRSQQQNRQAALAQLAYKVNKALYIPKKRVKARVPKALKEARLQAKKQRSSLKMMRSKKFHYD
jgi:ribosome-associated protein